MFQEPNLDNLLKALSSQTRRLIIQILSKSVLSGIDIYHEMKSKNKDCPNRESIYKELQKLVESKIIKKSYNPKEKEIQYELYYSKFTLDLASMEFKFL